MSVADDQPSVLSRLRRIWRETAHLGGVLPSEETLARQLGVSKPTVREAMIRLEAEGLVRRAQGAGTFPNLAALDVTARLDRRVDYSQQLADLGFEPEMEVVSAERVQIDDKRAALLEIPRDFVCFETVKRWKADGIPVMVARDIVPLRRQPQVQPVRPGRPRPVETAPAAEDSELSVLRLAATYGRGEVEWISTWPGATNADTRTAELLDLREGLALLTLEHIGVGRQGARCFHAFEYHSAGFVRYGLTLDARPDH